MSAQPHVPLPVSPTGLLAIDKPIGLTSMDVCRRVRRRLIKAGAPKRVKVGHGGTLDPLATGVLVVLIGKATRLCDEVMAGEKGYVAEVSLAAFSTTDDAEGERSEVVVATPPTAEAVARACAGFVGRIMQRPPVYSALKINGQAAYALARKGELEKIPQTARPVEIHEIRVVAYDFPRLVLAVRCGKGVYIRSLARDLGTTLGTGGMLTGLRRTRVGRWLIEECRQLDTLPEALTQADLLPVPNLVDHPMTTSSATVPTVATSATPGETRPIKSARLAALPPFLFNAIDDKKRAAMAAGKDVINLGVGDPDRPTPGFIIEALERAARVPANHQYPDCYGTAEFLSAVAEFMMRRFGVKVDPKRHVVATIGGKDGIAHLPLGVVNPGDGVVVFTPAYPVYASASALAGGVVHRVQTTAADRWLPNFAGVPETALRGTRLMWLNHPGNPTGSAAHLDTYQDAIRLCGERGIILASDLAYSEIYFEGGPASVPSMWQAPGADLERTAGIEFHSLSKTFNMTGWRIGFAVGNEQVISALKQVKDNYDSGVFNAIQAAGAAALRNFDHAEIAGMRAEYQKRRDLVVPALKAIGCVVQPEHGPEAGIFVWARCPVDSATGKPMSSWRFVEKLIDEAAVVTVPGAGFADSAADCFRLSLTRETSRLGEAMARLGGLRF
jgi:LL-diaminopimelate aminotransferase